MTQKCVVDYNMRICRRRGYVDLLYQLDYFGSEVYQGTINYLVGNISSNYLFPIFNWSLLINVFIISRCAF